MNSSTTHRFVFYSTPKSRDSGAVSLLAVAETLICVALYWMLWLKWGVTWHHWLIVVSTPLVLMRSKASVLKGLTWFEAYYKNDNVIPLTSAKGFGIQTLCFVAIFIVIYYVLNNRVVTSTVWPLNWQFALLSLFCMNFIFALEVALLGPRGGVGPRGEVGTKARERPQSLVMVVVAVSTVPGAAAGVWFRAIFTRSAATFLHPFRGLKSIPANWQYLIWHSDLFDPPELIPGHKRTNFLMLFDRLISVSSTWEHWLVLALFSPILYIPTLLWRWSIKSTAWFYLPLLWVGLGWQNIHGEELLIWAKGYSSKWFNLIGMLLATILLFGSFVALIVPSDYFDLQRTLKDSGAPLPVFGWAFVLDWQSLAAQPWQWFYIPSWVLTLFLFFVIDNHGTDIEKGANPKKHLHYLRCWMWACNTRVILTSLGLFTGLFYFLAAVDAWGQVMTIFS